MNKLINCLAISIGLVVFCALMVGAAKHHGNKTRAVWCQQTCSEWFPIDEKACFMWPGLESLQHVSLKCASCRKMKFCNFGKCTDSSCKQDKGTTTTTTKKPDEHEKDSICKEFPCKAYVKPSEYVCAKAKAKNIKRPAKLKTLKSKKCMEWINKCKRNFGYNFELCHVGACERGDDLDSCN